MENDGGEIHRQEVLSRWVCEPLERSAVEMTGMQNGLASGDAGVSE